LDALAILKIQVHRDRGKEFADSRRFALATNIEVYFCDPQSRGSAGRKLRLRKVRFLAAVVRT
jgi:IS30 family transposase